MPTIGTLLNPTQALNELYLKLVTTQDNLKKRLSMPDPVMRVDADLAAFNSSTLTSATLDKFYDTLLRTIIADAQRIAEYAQRNPQSIKQVEKGLEKLHELFKEAHKFYLDNMKTAHFFLQFSDRLDGITRKLISGNKRLEAIHKKRLAEELKKRAKAEKEMQEQLRKQKEAVATVEKKKKEIDTLRREMKKSR